MCWPNLLHLLRTFPSALSIQTRTECRCPMVRESHDRQSIFFAVLIINFSLLHGYRWQTAGTFSSNITSHSGEWVKTTFQQLDNIFAILSDEKFAIEMIMTWLGWVVNYSKSLYFNYYQHMFYCIFLQLDRTVVDCPTLFPSIFWASLWLHVLRLQCATWSQPVDPFNGTAMRYTCGKLRILAAMRFDTSRTLFLSREPSDLCLNFESFWEFVDVRFHPEPNFRTETHIPLRQRR